MSLPIPEPPVSLPGPSYHPSFASSSSSSDAHAHIVSSIHARGAEDARAEHDDDDSDGELFEQLEDELDGVGGEWRERRMREMRERCVWVRVRGSVGQCGEGPGQQGWSSRNRAGQGSRGVLLCPLSSTRESVQHPCRRLCTALLSAQH
jgi:hypothetical protein